ncbi:MAG TPA: DNA replication and repair protein RecF [Gemmatimonadales bacterium]|nr:DNA replication and repair protein RecF [Gemmatimonadales bacterium]
MRLRHLVARGFRNLADGRHELPPRGLALLGANAQGKSNFLEAVYYPVVFRSFRGAQDQAVAAFGGPGFHLEAAVERADAADAVVTATWQAAGRRKRIAVDEVESERVSGAVGHWLAVVFLPADLGLASGPAPERRHYLDRLLSLADSTYLRALSRYRAALAQRNAALRQARPELAWAFDRPLAEAGAAVVAARCAWAGPAAERFAAEFECLGEGERASLSYRGTAELADADAWEPALWEARDADRSRGMTTVGPHRDDLILRIGGRLLREYGSTGQLRSAAVALKLLEIETLRETRGTEPGLLLDDVFAELDRDRQRRLAVRLLGGAERQVFLTAPRPDELPPGLELEVRRMAGGRVSRA